MNLHIILTILLSSITFALSTPSAFDINQSTTNGSIILKNILTNYLRKYFSDEKMFVSIIIPSVNKQWNTSEADFFDNLFNDSILTDFSYNVLDTLNGSVCDNKNAFNLILVDDIKSLP